MKRKDLTKKRLTDLPEPQVSSDIFCVSLPEDQLQLLAKEKGLKKKIDTKEKVKKEFKEDKNNKICHYCGEMIHNVLSESSECYCDVNGFWYCSAEEYEEYKTGFSFF